MLKNGDNFFFYVNFVYEKVLGNTYGSLFHFFSSIII